MKFIKLTEGGKRILVNVDLIVMVKPRRELTEIQTTMDGFIVVDEPFETVVETLTRDHF